MTAGVIFSIFVVARIAGRRAISDSRRVLLHTPIDQAWEAVSNFPRIHARHARGRPAVSVQESMLKSGDGRSVGSVWRQRGKWAGRDFWADLELVEYRPPRLLAVRLVRDSFGTHHGLMRHQCTLTLDPEGPALTKLTWQLQACLRGLRLTAAQFHSPEQVRSRLLDLGLRSLKVAIDAKGLEEIGAGQEVAHSGVRPGAPGELSPDHPYSKPSGSAPVSRQDQA